ncbi:MAG: YbjN domain-containing protein [Epsilonproteobacteria bacterium]|nr:YbjN domain-containing protein [Campylobacterota bacterium]
MRFILLALLLAATSLFAYTDEELVSILKDDGYTAVTIVKKGVIRVKVNGRSYALFQMSDGDLQAYYGISGLKVPCEKINTWNRTRRTCRAYLDRQNDPVLEADLISNGGGYSPKKVQAFFRIFLVSADKFRDFLLNK